MQCVFRVQVLEGVRSEVAGLPFALECMIRQHAVSVTVGVGCRGVCASCADHSAVLRWQCVNLTVCVLVLTCMSSRREGGDVFWRPHSQTTPVGYAFPTLIAHVGIPVAVPRG